jgi:hypothetical protein
MMGNKLFFAGAKRKKILTETALFLFKRVIISVITINYQKLRMLFFFCATGLSAVPYASAQQPVAAPATEIPATPSVGAASLVAHNLSTNPNHTLSLSAPVNSSARQPDRTKVIRIYGGAGFFDLLLAEKLRPRLSKGFAASKSGIAKPTAGEISAPAQVDGPKLIPVVSNL